MTDIENNDLDTEISELQALHLQVASLREQVQQTQIAYNEARLAQLNVESQLANASSTTNTPRVYEPKIADPEYFYGKRDKVATFITQCNLKFLGQPSRFPTENAKVTFAASFLRDVAFSWVKPLLSIENCSELESFKNFSEALQNTFGDPDIRATSERQIRALTQTGSAANYATEFRRISAYILWNEEAQISQFYIGLKDHVKDELARIDRPTTFSDLVTLAIRIDNRFYERKLERNERITRDKSKVSNNHYAGNKRTAHFPSSVVNAPSTPTHGGYEPMQIDASRPFFKKLTDEEKKRRMENKLCLYCGKPGHMAKDCPASSKKKIHANTTTAKPKKTKPSVSSITFTTEAPSAKDKANA